MIFFSAINKEEEEEGFWEGYLNQEKEVICIGTLIIDEEEIA